MVFKLKSHFTKGVFIREIKLLLVSLCVMLMDVSITMTRPLLTPEHVYPKSESWFDLKLVKCLYIRKNTS